MRHARIIDVEDSLVRAEAQSVGIDGVFDGEFDLALRREAEDGLDVKLALHVLADHAGNDEAAGGIGPIDRAVRAHDDVVWAVEFLALPARRKGRERTVMLDAPDGRCDQPAMVSRPSRSKVMPLA